MKLFVQKATTSKIVHVFIQDAAATDGSGKTGLTTTSIKLGYMRDGASAAVDVTTINSVTTLGTFNGPATAAAFKEVSSTVMPGVYELHLPNNALATGAEHVSFVVQDAASNGAAPVPLEIQLLDYDPAALADASGRVDVGKWLGTAVTTSATTSLPEVDTKSLSDDAAAAESLELIAENAKGTDNRILVSSDAQDLSASLHVNTKTLSNDAITAAAMATDAIGAIADQVWDEARTDHKTLGSFGQAMHALATVSGKVSDASASVHEFGTDLIEVTNDAYCGGIILMTSGSAVGEFAPILRYNGGTGDIYLAHPLRTAPDNNSEFMIVPGNRTANPIVSHETYVGAVTDQTHLVLHDAPGGDDDYNGMIAKIVDADTDQASFRKITDFAAATDTITLESAADFTVAANDIVQILGVPINDLSTADVKSQVDQALVDIDLDHLAKDAAGIPANPAAGTFIDQMMNKSGGQTFDPADDSLEAIRDRGDAAWSASAGNPELLVDTTVATVVDQTHLQLAAALGADDTYNDMLVVLYDVSASDTPSIRKITDFVDTNNEIVLDSAPEFTVAAGDKVRIFAVAPGTTAPTAVQVADAVLDELTSEHQTAGSLGAELHLAKAMLANKRTHTVSTGVDRIMDDDGTTVLRTMTPTDDGDDTITVNPS